MGLLLPVGLLTQIVILVAFFLTVANIFAYGVLAPWYRSRPGRWLFILLNALAATLGLAAFRILFGDFPFRAELVLVTFALYIGAMLYLLATIVREQVSGASRRRRLLDDTSHHKEK